MRDEYYLTGTYEELPNYLRIPMDVLWKICVITLFIRGISRLMNVKLSRVDRYGVSRRRRLT